MDVNKIISESIQKVIGEDASEAKETAKEKLMSASKKIAGEAGEAKEKMLSAGKKIAGEAGEAGGEIKEKVTSAGKKAIEAVQEHPGVAAAVAAALAAGVGGLALRKKLKHIK